jgi:hypothetical protein
MDNGTISKQWNYNLNLRDNGLPGSTTFNLFRPAHSDIAGFYCPTRRSDMNVIKLTNVRRLDPNWQKGGNDYSGCAGGNAYIVNEVTRGTYALMPDQIPNDLTFQYSPSPLNRGVFFPNSKTRIADIQDGTSQVIMAGENARLNAITTINLLISSDGWGWAGAATLFVTRSGLNKGLHFDGPASEHEAGGYFLFCDGRVNFLNQNLNLLTFQLLGSMSDGTPLADYESQ